MAHNLKRLENPGETDRKRQKSKTIISIVIAVMLIGSTLGYALLSMEKTESRTETTSVNFRGLIFSKQSGTWETQISGHSFYFSYLPNETLYTDLSRTLDDYTGKPLYFTEENEAVHEIDRNIGSFAQRFQKACISGNCTENIPIKNCTSNIIIIEKSNLTSIYQEDNCTYIMTNDIIRGADTFLYRILGIR